ncbi:phosphatidylinositol phosphatase PTPRQ-like [Saccostrea cucullata]|uniref:phosphatidylinositol phosphatase PTPRQ-like n=1 Tax=Saccostrea cuccullata TaxID=36930 RepID=UPI002ECFDF3D
MANNCSLVPTVTVPEDTAVIYGYTAKLNATVVSLLPITSFKWQKINSGIPTNISFDDDKYAQDLTINNESYVLFLLINNTEFPDEGQYRVVLELPGILLKSKIIFLKVTGERPAVALSEPLESSSTITIPCLVTISSDSPPLLGITWLKNGRSINITGNFRKYNGGSLSNPNITIHNVDSKDQGNYYCEAWNAIGKSSSDVITLRPPIIFIHGNSSAPLGGKAMILGNMSSVLSLTDIKWQSQIESKGILTIDVLSAKYNGSSTSLEAPILIINNIDMNDNATYVLIASNKLGTTVSNSMHLQIIMVPVVSLNGPSHVLEGSSAVLRGTIKSTETTTDTWLKQYNGMSSIIFIDNYKYVRRFVITGDNEKENILEIRNVGFQDMVFYQLRVSNSAGESFSNRIHLDPIRAPPLLADSALVMNNIVMETTIKITLNATFFTNDMNGHIVYFGVAVCSDCTDLNKQPRTLSYMWETLQDWYEARMNQFTLYRTTDDNFMTAIKLHVQELGVSRAFLFTIGEDNSCHSRGPRSYCNGPLRPGLTYRLILFACTLAGCSQSGSIGPFQTTIAQSSKAGSTVPVVVGSTLGVIVIVILAVVVIVLVHRKYRDKRKKYTDLSMSRIGEGKSGYTQLRRDYNIKPIRVDSLLNHVYELTKENGARLSNEFSELTSLVSTSSAIVGKLMQNFEKNRSSTIPYDFNRVKLHHPLELPEMNYINASHVFNNEYIITQYPQRRTMIDFWDMIWEQNVSAIVMLAPLNEMEKCFRYYRRKQGASCTYGDVVIKLMATFMYGKNLKGRKLNVYKKKNKRVKRIITHFHVYALDESTVAKDIVDCIKIIRSNIQAGVKPLVVHSGSGPEWSGVFVLMDYIIQKIRKGSETIDISSATLQLLDERMAVLSKNQYALLYFCLENYLKQSTIKHVSSSPDGEESASSYETLP